MSIEPFILPEITVIEPRKVRAFSLLELMVVVSIIGLMAAISVPAI